VTDQVVKGHGWTATPNALLRDGKIKAVSKVVYSLLAGFSPEFRFSRRTLQSMAGAGKDTIQKALRELIATRWIDRHQHRGSSGKFFYTYTIHAHPHPPVNASSPVPCSPVPCLPAPVPPAPVDQALLEEQYKKEQKKKDHKQAGVPQMDFELFTISGKITAIFAGSQKPVTQRAIQRFTECTQEHQWAHIADTLEDVFARVPKASAGKIFAYTLENLTENHPLRSNNFEPGPEPKTYTEQEIESCIPFS